MPPLRLESPWHVDEALVRVYDAFIFDLDGVLWRGGEAIAGASDALAWLASRGKAVFLLTNNSLQCAADFAAKLRRLGIAADFPVRNILTSSKLTALLLEHEKVTGKVLTLGTESMLAELRGHFAELAKKEKVPSVEFVEPPTTLNPGSAVTMPGDFAGLAAPPDVAAVVMGFDPHFNYCRAAYVTALLTARPSTPFIGTNADLRFPASGGQLLPGTGSFIRAIEVATGRHAVIAGKPGPTALREILRRSPGLRKDRILMVGDNLLTDVAFGRANGIATALVETGVHKLRDAPGVERRGAHCTPDFIVRSIADFAWKEEEPEPGEDNSDS